MASGLDKAFHHSSGGFASGFTNLQPSRESSQSHGHGILHNLLADAINTAKGIPFGIVQTVEHPERTLKAVGRSYAETYGHGWGHFWHEFHAHPLQPLLDAISVPLMLAGGAGAAIKGADVAAQIGNRAVMDAAIEESSALAKAGKFAEADKVRYEASAAPRLTKAADRFRKGTSATTRMVKTDVPGLSLPKAYSSNLFRRALTKGADAIIEGAGNRATATAARFGKESKFGDVFSTEGVGRRMAAKDRARREAATAAEAKGAAHVLLGVRRSNLSTHTAAIRLVARAKSAIMGGAHRISEADAGKLAGDSNVLKHYQFIERDSEMVPTFDPKTGDYIEHLEKWNADELSRQGARHTMPQWQHAHKAMLGRYWDGADIKGQLFRDEDQFLTMKERQAGVSDVPAKGSVGTEQKHGVETLFGGPAKAGATEEAAFVKKLGSVYKYTNDPAKAMRDSEGNLLLVRKGIGDTVSREMEGSAKLAEAIYRTPITVWKGFILAGAPRYFVNNVIGNAGMYAAATNPVEFTRGVAEAIRSTRGIRAASRFEREAGRQMEAYLKKYLPDDIVSNHFAFLQHGALGLDQTIGFAQSGKLGRLKAGLYPVTEKVSYRGPQRASIMGAITTMPEFRSLLRTIAKKEPHLNRYERFQKAAGQLMADPRRSAAVEKRVTDWAGQYYHLNGVERMITALVPFYNWDRHALRFGKEQALSRPVSSIVLSQLGALGDAEANKELGKVPDFLKGAIPIKGHSAGVLGFLFGQQLNGRKKVILSAGYNPLAAASEDVHALAALAGGGNPAEALSGQLNPVVSGAIAGITGSQPFTGAPAPGGPVKQALSATFGELPQTRLAKTELGFGPDDKTKKGDPTLYTHDLRQQISSIFGLNERDFSPKAADNLYRKEHHIRKGRRHAKAMARAFKSSSSNF
jgi:hypothetical protein